MTNDALHQPIEAYLKNVEAACADRPERERRELIDALRRHIADALRSRSVTPTAQDVAAVLAAMDAPEDYADPVDPPGAPTTAPIPDPPRRPDQKWFILALCFLALNAWFVWTVVARRDGVGPAAEQRTHGVTFTAGADGEAKGSDVLTWSFDAPVAPSNLIGQADATPRVKFVPEVAGAFKWASDRELVFTPAAPWGAGLDVEAVTAAGWPGRTGDVFRIRTAPLALQQVLQAGFTQDREATLRLEFNAAPARQRLEKFIELTDKDRRKITYEVVGDAADRFVMIQTAPLMAGNKVEVHVKSGLQPETGTRGLVVEQKMTLNIAEGMELAQIEAASPPFEAAQLYAYFTDAVEVERAAAFISVSPEVKFDVEPVESWRWQQAGCRLVGGFTPGAVYKITFKAGLKSVNGYQLVRDVIRVVQFPDCRPSIAFGAPGRYLSPGGSLKVPVAVMNLDTVAVSAEPVLAQNLVQLVMREDSRYASYYGSGPQDNTSYLTAEAAVHTMRVARVMNKEQRVVVDLRAITASEPSGAYLVSARAAGRGSAEQIVVVTDLGLVARKASDGMLVWVNSLRDATPRAGVELQLFAVNGQELARGVTAADGTASLKLDKANRSEPILLMARHRKDVSYLKLSDTLLATPEGGKKPYLTGAYEASLYTDRGIYRPGETIHLRALVRDRQLGCPEPFPVQFRIVQPDGAVMRRFPAMLDGYAAAGADVELPTFAATGPYHLELVVPGSEESLGQTEIAVEEFVPPQIRVKLEGPTNRLSDSDDFRVTVRADHLFGRPAAGLPVSGSVRLEPAAFAPSNWPSHVFGDAERTFAPSERVASHAYLDQEGGAAFEFAIDFSAHPPAALRGTAAITVTEAGGRAVTSYHSINVDPYPFYIGLQRRDNGAVPVGVTQRVGVVVVTPDGKALAENKPLKAVWSTIHHNTVLKRGSDGRFAYVAERTLQPVKEQLITAGLRSVPVEFAPPASGEYLLVVSDADSGASSSIHLTAAAKGESWVTWSRERPDLIELVADRESYRPGDMARITIKAPFAGQALMTMESERLHQQRVFSMTGTTTVIEVPVRAEDAPNVYCSVMLLRPVRPEEVWMAHRAAGAVSLAVKPRGRQLRALVSAPETTRPSQPVDLKVRLVDEAGQPVVGDCTVAVVDEAICMLTDFATPDPMLDLLTPRFAGINVYDLYSQLMPVYDEAGAGRSSPAGDGSSAFRRRLNPIQGRRFTPLALWKSGVHTDTNGEALVRVDLPEFAGEVRVMAVGWNREQAGSGEAHMKVKRSLVAQSALPRFLAPGDRADATLRIFNESKGPMSGITRLTVGGPARVERPERSFQLKAGDSVTERLAVEGGPSIGVANVSLETMAGAENIRETFELPVRPGRAVEVFAEAARVDAGGTTTLRPPTNWINATQNIRISGRPEVRLVRSMNYLLQYPYGCLEQTVSQTLPLIWLPELARGSIGREEATRFIQAGLLRVLRMQTADGQFTMWPESSARQGWAILYATHLLVEAQRANIEVPAERLELALKATRERLKQESPLDADSREWREDAEERAYACYILARAGHPDAGWVARLDELNNRLSPASRAFLAGALLAGHEPRRARELLSKTPLPNVDERVPTAIYRSGVRDAAVLLLAWVDQDPASPAAAALADELVRIQKNGHWGDTQRDAWALMALGAYAARQSAKPQVFQATALVDGRELPIPPAGMFLTNVNTCVIRNQGPGPVYALSQSEGVPATGTAVEQDEGLTIRRAWLNSEGEPLDTRELHQGDLVVVRLTLDTMGVPASDIVIEDLLPAGLEIENPALATSQRRPVWIKEKADWCIAQSARDDRMLYFSGFADGSRTIYYTARAVSPGRFILPPVTASGMYDPTRRSVSGGGVMTVVP